MSRYSGKRVVLYNALVSHDPYDQFAWCQEWRFAISDYLEWKLGVHIPEFRSPGGPDAESYPFQELLAGKFSEDELLYAYRILTRYREWLRLAGEDY